MRLVTLMSIVLAAGCASEGAKAPPVEREVAVDASNIVPAQKAGYKVVNKDGQTLYCKRNPKTGSHARFTTSCLTGKEWEDLAETSRRGVEAMSRQTSPPHGT